MHVLPLRIQAQIESTPTLRTDYYVKEDERPPAIVALPDSTSATAGSPVVLVRGSRSVMLTVVGAVGPVQWSIARPSNAVLQIPAGTPTLSSNFGQTVKLTTDAVGTYAVCATCTRTQRQAFWHVLFAAVELVSGFRVRESVGNVVFQRVDGIAVLSDFSFDTAVCVYGGGGYRDHYAYDRVGVGVIQNLLDPKTEGLKGEYSQGAKRGTFAESLPAPSGPWVDASDNLPLYDARVNRAPGTVRTIEFTDAPGLVVPPFVLPSGMKATPCDQKDSGAFSLSGARGMNQFRTAVVAWSTYAPHTFVVVATLDWELRLDVGIKNLGADSPTAVQRGSGGTRLTRRPDEHPTPRDARDAGFEVYGPEATSEAGEDEPSYDKYVWRTEQDAPPSNWAAARAPVAPGPTMGQQRVLLSRGARAQSEKSNTSRSGSSGGGKDEQ